MINNENFNPQHNMYTEESFISDLRDPKKATFRSRNTAKFFVENNITTIDAITERLLLTGKTGSKEALVNMFHSIGMNIPKELKQTAYKMNVVSAEDISKQQIFLSDVSERKFMLKNKKPQQMLKPLAE